MRIIIAVSLVFCLLGQSLQRAKSLKSSRLDGLGHEWSGLTSYNKPSQLVAAINFARTNPRGFAARAKQSTVYFNKGVPVKYSSDPNCVEIAFNFLLNQKPLPAFGHSEVLTLAAYQHTAYMVRKNQLTHYEPGTPYNMPGDRVKRWTTQANADAGEIANVSGHVKRDLIDVILQWIVDLNVPDRGHRAAIFSGATHIGCAEISSSSGSYATCDISGNYPTNTRAPGYADIKKAAGI